MPSWETDMAQALQTDDGVDHVIPVDWSAASNLPIRGVTEAEGSLLATAIVLTADTMVLAEGSPGDVVDLDLIGHSRGAVVISQALQDLDGTTFPALAGGFKKMTLLDPHPANNGYSKPDYSAGSDRLSRALVRIYRWLQAHMQDPQVIIPPNVNEADLYYQHSPASAFPRGSEEAHLNLWGEDPSLIVNQSSAPLTVLKLTGDVDPDFGTIGHSEVPLWYDEYIVQQGIVFQGYSGPGDSVDQSAIARGDRTGRLLLGFASGGTAAIRRSPSIRLDAQRSIASSNRPPFG